MMKRWIRIERIPEPLASAYEKASRMVQDSYYRKMSEEIVASGREGLFLDVGTGPGYLPIAIAGRSSALRVVGVDLSRPLVRMARISAAREGLSGRPTFGGVPGAGNPFQPTAPSKSPARERRPCSPRRSRWSGRCWMPSPGRRRDVSRSWAPAHPRPR
jgi:SAM-dependent methyltransferase